MNKKTTGQGGSQRDQSWKMGREAWTSEQSQGHVQEGACENNITNTTDLVALRASGGSIQLANSWMMGPYSSCQ